MPIGCAGIVYSKNSLDLDVLRDKMYLEIAPTADDLWFRASSMKRMVPVFVDPDIGRMNGYIHHGMGLLNMNLTCNKNNNVLLSKVLQKVKGYLGLPVIGNDYSWKMIKKYLNL